ncbi:MAG TPA: kinase/pyrophosphorylase [Alphaproteobacteria bacterium]|nr:kinase/pyrophosphorylase [Alphaproteobacteria bacterium]
MKTFHIHLVSDSTGETVSMVARACLVQFDDAEPTEHIWSMVRTQARIKKVLKSIKANPGIILYTLVDDAMRRGLEEGCREIKVPCISLLDPTVEAIGAYIGAEIHAEPGRQHTMNAGYFNRIEAMHFVLAYDDGQLTRGLDKAEVIIVGVSRTSKTPTCLYLANRGIKAANIPVVPGAPLPEELASLKKAFIVGLTCNPKQLVQIRRNRLKSLNRDERSDYIDNDMVADEIREAKRIFKEHGWPIIDVTRKSIEEVAANIMSLYQRRQKTQTVKT